MDVVENWFKEQCEQAMNEMGRVREKDGEILVSMAKRFPKFLDKYVLFSSQI